MLCRLWRRALGLEHKIREYLLPGITDLIYYMSSWERETEVDKLVGLHGRQADIRLSLNDLITVDLLLGTSNKIIIIIAICKPTVNSLIDDDSIDRSHPVLILLIGAVSNILCFWSVYSTLLLRSGLQTNSSRFRLIYFLAANISFINWNTTHCPRTPMPTKRGGVDMKKVICLGSQPNIE